MSWANRRYVREKEARRLLSEFSDRVKGVNQYLASTNSPVEVAGTDDIEIYFVEGEPTFANSDGKLFPVLSSTKVLLYMPKAVVNMGAVPYVCNGADIMAPGIVRYEGTFDKEDLVVVLDERHSKPISIAMALYNSRESEKLKRGKVLRNIHYVGDGVWKTMKQAGRSK